MDACTTLKERERLSGIMMAKYMPQILPYLSAMMTADQRE